LGKTFNAVSSPWGQAVYPTWWPILTKDQKDIQTEQTASVLGVVWQQTDTEHTTTFGSKQSSSSQQYCVI